MDLASWAQRWGSLKEYGIGTLLLLTIHAYRKTAPTYAT